jgi:hypothetical protein
MNFKRLRANAGPQIIDQIIYKDCQTTRCISKYDFISGYDILDYIPNSKPFPGSKIWITTFSVRLNAAFPLSELARIVGVSTCFPTMLLG